ncbi:MAG: transcription termination/antitermination protein NusA [Chloroflexi bacterium]|nr:MAG: transcription termination/antitermination protein NusA [Chloroflexota bacterium]
MRNDLSRAIRLLAAERSLPEDVVMQALEAAMIAAYRKTPEAWAQNVRIGVDPNTGESKVLAQLAVVEEVQDKRTQISLEDARKIDPDVEVGGLVEVDVTPDDFGRIAAQTAKQVILQRIREAEREVTYHTYADREGEIVQGTIQNMNPDGITVSLDKAEALLPRANQMPTERYTRNQRIRVYVQEVRKTPKGPEIIVSRTHKNMLRRLMELEVPEIFNGAVEIKAIAREAGSRSKVAVAARQEGVDPVGACVGIRGVRIQALVNELSGEKIDVVAWDPDPAVFIANALSPAQVTNVRLVEAPEGRTAEVVVPDRQLSLAIGKEGQNARLAAKLTGWRIDIKSESEAAEEAIRRIQEEARRAERLKELEAARALLAEAEAAEAGGVTEAVAADSEAEALEEVTEPAVPTPAEAVVEEAEAGGEAEPSAPVTPTGDEAAPGDEPAPPKKKPTLVDWQVLVQEEQQFDESGEPLPKKGKKKRKHRRLEYDEHLGEVVARKRRKPGREQERWQRDIERWRDWEDEEDWEEELDDFTDEEFADFLEYEEEEDEE